MKFKTKVLIFSLINIAILLIIGVLINRFILSNIYISYGLLVTFFNLSLYLYVGKITEPLYNTIDQLKQSNLDLENIKFRTSTTYEINKLNKELNAYSTQNKEQYLYQRQYSENLSHELLTPLAVIRAKTELILQSPNLRENDLLNLDGILQTVRRLSKVNQALILLSKISNNQFVDEEEIVLKDIIYESLENFEDQIDKKELQVSVNLPENEILKSNLNLLSILISNLIKNAVFHNVNNGTIGITLKDKTLTITNTGYENKKTTIDFFNRFISEKKSNDSIGLGLAIVKQICNMFDYKINYESKGTTHKIILSFKN